MCAGLQPKGFSYYLDRVIGIVSGYGGQRVEIIGCAILEYIYHPRIYRYSEDITILQVGDSELDFNHPRGAFSIWWQSGGRNVRVWKLMCPRLESGAATLGKASS